MCKLLCLYRSFQSYRLRTSYNSYHYTPIFHGRHAYLYSGELVGCRRASTVKPSNTRCAREFPLRLTLLDFMQQANC